MASHLVASTIVFFFNDLHPKSLDSREADGRVLAPGGVLRPNLCRHQFLELYFQTSRVNKCNDQIRRDYSDRYQDLELIGM